MGSRLYLHDCLYLHMLKCIRFGRLGQDNLSTLTLRVEQLDHMDLVVSNIWGIYNLYDGLRLHVLKLVRFGRLRRVRREQRHPLNKGTGFRAQGLGFRV